MYSWDDPKFSKAIEATGRKNIIISGLWTEVVVTWPTPKKIDEGYIVYICRGCLRGHFPNGS
jgi:hypothetical protein